MGWSVGDVDRMLAAASAKILDALAHTHTALQCWDESEAVLSEVLRGTSDQDAADVLARQGETSRQLAEVRGHLQAIVFRIEHYQHSLGTSATTATRPAATATPAPSDGATRSALPRPPRPGKTHGRWFDHEGHAVMLESGRGGPYYDAARSRAVELGLDKGIPGAEPAIARHVETQFVGRMIDEDLHHAEIEINRPVCGTTPKDQQWSDTCHRQLPRFLPPGWTLTIKDGSSPAGRTYTGKEVQQ
jgi:hypothetical protein